MAIAIRHRKIAMKINIGAHWLTEQVNFLHVIDGYHPPQY